eukprot:CAMPEP_0182427968 /NCGR_PEP_ID=MMETSP1167-20130531/20925_1 /TAXON_ID=2988 /ORGANISM="Mallomonas Sp, Strain CCMP3275" /LENGTH=157 /DNA_ID=CAMNT_0024610579 /DNA_START=218 /DNA_END=691 /DNA_ORIENTATION=-
MTGKADLGEYLRNLDTSLTPEQRLRVDKLKRRINGVNSPRSLYRDIPTPDEIDKHFSENPPLIPENAQELIDYALSFIPPREGRRGSRKKKRYQLKLLAKEKQMRVYKTQKVEANLKRLAKSKKQRELVRLYKERTVAVMDGADPRSADIYALPKGY